MFTKGKSGAIVIAPRIIRRYPDMAKPPEDWVRGSDRNKIAPLCQEIGGYGNFVSTADTVGWTLTKHLSINAGYQLGSRLVVTNNASSDRIGLRLTQKGALAGVKFSF
jgi:hypothetical protein